MFQKIASWISAWWSGPNRQPVQVEAKAAPAAPAEVSDLGLERIVLTEQVAQTLFDDFAAHRRSDRGDEEIGWFLLGTRQGPDALALATLPAGAQRNAGVAHVQFNSDAQALASRLVRRQDPRLVSLGIVHTHPGSMRHPSSGDYRGDIEWVQRLRGGEGVFGIGTADGEADTPAPNQQIEGNLCFSWYALGRGDRNYRRLPVSVTPGLDLARPLHHNWDTLELYALPLERLLRQLRGAVLEVVDGGLALTIDLAEAGQRLRVVVQNAQARYYVEQGSGISAVDPEEPSLERAVYLILAELAQPVARAGIPTARR